MVIVGNKVKDEVITIDVVAPSGVNISRYFVHINRIKSLCPITDIRNCTQPYTCDPILHDKCTCFSEECQKYMCHQNCNGNGFCDKFVGKCNCFTKYEGEYCEQFVPYTVPLKQSIKITLLWGTTGDFVKDTDQFILDSYFNLLYHDEIHFIINTFNRIKNTKLLNFRNKTKKTWIEQNMTSESARKHLLTLSRRPTFHQYIGTTENGDEERITWIAVDFYLNVSKNTPAFTMYLDHYLVWKSFVNDINLDSPSSLGNVVMISSSWTEMDITIGIIISTIESFLTSNFICFISVLVFTGDIALSILTMVSILLIVVCLLGTLLGPIFNYTFGAIEAVGVTVFIGMSVDYALHVAHGYHSSTHKSRYAKVRATLTHLGISILGGAITTGGSAIFLLFCKIYFFLQLGTMMLLNVSIHYCSSPTKMKYIFLTYLIMMYTFAMSNSQTILALIFSMGWLCSMLLILGPTTSICDIYFYIKLPIVILLWVFKKIFSLIKLISCCGKKKKVSIDDVESDESDSDFEFL